MENRIYALPANLSCSTMLKPLMSKIQLNSLLGRDLNDCQQLISGVFHMVRMIKHTPKTVLELVKSEGVKVGLGAYRLHPGQSPCSQQSNNVHNLSCVKQEGVTWLAKKKLTMEEKTPTFVQVPIKILWASGDKS